MFDRTQRNYLSFRDIYSEKTSQIIAWTGAGLSVPAKLPTWIQLRDHLREALEDKSRTVTGPESDQLRQKAKQVASEKNLWVAFQILKRSLGPTSYRDAIREKFKAAETVPIPKGYLQLLQLRLSGILNLNLDRLATRAYGKLHPGHSLNEFYGTNAGGHMHLLKSPRPFVVNLHGTIPEESSWVFTQAELQRLLENDGYRAFIASCLSTRTVLFLGMSADDHSVTHHLKSLAKAKVDFGSHFWVTSRTDSETDRLAEDLGIRIIRYQNDSGSHAELEEFFQDLSSHVSIDTPAPPVAFSAPVGVTEPLPPPEALAVYKTEDIRRTLNSHASIVLAPDTPEAYREFDEFLKIYDEAIYRAWYVGTVAPNNVLLGYEINRQIGKGAFGRVFHARAPDGEAVAVKVLHEEVRRSADMLQSFRRGVRSMQILSKHGVRGMVPYRAASEIPAFAVMDFVNGPDLLNAVKSGRVQGWSMLLRIAVDLARIIRSAHMLPERVLHRDLRPSNIMLKGFHESPDGNRSPA